MSEWGSGYVTDTAYVHDFCRVQTPTILSFAALAKSVAAPGLEGKPLTYCDLGCGQGFTANLVAAANPAAEVFAADFNPTHIAGARSLAAAAGMNNIVFREADFEELLHDSSLPDFDIICMHGVLQLDQRTAPADDRRLHSPPSQTGGPPLRIVRRHARLGGHRPAAARPRAARRRIRRVVRNRVGSCTRVRRQTQGARRSILPDVSARLGANGSPQETSQILSGARAPHS
jgi:SAM-dependent methyltransferase